MASKKVRQRISYVLEDARSLGHRLGVNGLAVDSENNILYSGGRDGVVCAWDLHLDKPTQPAHPDDKPDKSDDTNKDKDTPARPHVQTATSRAQTQAHTHWINDIALAQNNSALVTASSDLLVKIWRPRIGDNDDEPAVLGKHADYVKCVASPGQQASWVASGGLDRRICLWDLQGAGKILEIDVSGEEQAEKGSVYALRANHNVLASGGPESTVRLWDPRTGQNITKFVGHTDNVRSILVNESGDTVMTASSDQTVKIWSVTAGRCMHTLTMHNDSVWSLYSDVPDLSVFYSSDRSGLVVKTDLRGCTDDVDHGLSVAVAQEHGGVSKVVASSGYIWTATSSSSINRWADVDTSGTFSNDPPTRPFSPSAETVRPHSSSVSTVTGANGVPVPSPSPAPRRTTRTIPADIPAKSILRISNMAVFPIPSPGTAPSSPIGGHATLADAVPGSSGTPGRSSTPAPAHSRKGSLVPNGIDSAPIVAEPAQRLPVETIEGNCGLVKHRLLNDRRRVLTLDTAGDVILWDIIACKQIRQFGKRHLEDVEPEVNTTEAVAPWCSVDVSSGQLTVVLEQYNCFDAEMYADELEDLQEYSDKPAQSSESEFRDDMRINLGKWVLRYLFSNLIDEELARDNAFRAKLNEPIEKRLQAAEAAAGDDSAGQNPHAAFARAAGMVPPTPGIGLATPLPMVGSTPLGTAKRTSQASREDYFSNGISSVEPTTPGIGLTGGVPQTPAPANTATTPAADKGKDSKDKEKEKDASASATKSTAFGKKLRLGMSFGTKKLGRSASTSVPDKAAGAGVDDSKGANGTANGTSEENKSESASSHDKEFDDCFAGLVQRMQHDYEKQLLESPDRVLVSRMSPFQADEAPVLQIPPKTKVIIQEELTGGSIELYRGTVGGMGQAKDVDKIERTAPMWLAEALLSNTAQIKETTKISFLLLPYKDLLPQLPVPAVPEPPATTPGVPGAPPPAAPTPATNRLNANRMLRVKKILAYVAEKLEAPAEGEAAGTSEAEASEAAAPAAEAEAAPAAADDLKPEEYLELYCNDQRLPNAMSLATVRAHIWKNSSDILLYYKSNGRKQLPSVEAKVDEAAAPSTASRGTRTPPNGDDIAV